MNTQHTQKFEFPKVDTVLSAVLSVAVLVTFLTGIVDVVVKSGVI